MNFNFSFQKVLRLPNVVVYMGCVGRDSYSEILEKKAREDGVDCRYQYTTEEPTGISRVYRCIFSSSPHASKTILYHILFIAQEHAL